MKSGCQTGPYVGAGRHGSASCSGAAEKWGVRDRMGGGRHSESASDRCSYEAKHANAQMNVLQSLDVADSSVDDYSL